MKKYIYLVVLLAVSFICAGQKSETTVSGVTETITYNYAGAVLNKEEQGFVQENNTVEFNLENLVVTYPDGSNLEFRRLTEQTEGITVEGFTYRVARYRATEGDQNREVWILKFTEIKQLNIIFEDGDYLILVKIEEI